MSPETVGREELDDATILTVHATEVREGTAEFAAARAAVLAVAEGNKPVIVDLSAVELLTSAFLGCLIMAWRRLARLERAAQAPRHAWQLFTFYANREEALAAVRGGEPRPLVFCGVNRDIRDIFLVC